MNTIWLKITGGSAEAADDRATGVAQTDSSRDEGPRNDVQRVDAHFSQRR